MRKMVRRALMDARLPHGIIELGPGSARPRYMAENDPTPVEATDGK
jgi:hypothetical protein